MQLCKARDGLHYCRMGSASQAVKTTSTSSPGTAFQPLLLALALIVAAATVGYSVAWMYYIHAHDHRGSRAWIPRRFLTVSR